MFTREKATLVAAIWGIVTVTLASPSSAQPPGEPRVNAARESAVHECSVANAKYHGSWQGHQTARYRACMFEHGEVE